MYTLIDFDKTTKTWYNNSTNSKRGEKSYGTHLRGTTGFPVERRHRLCQNPEDGCRLCLSYYKLALCARNSSDAECQ